MPSESIRFCSEPGAVSGKAGLLCLPASRSSGRRSRSAFEALQDGGADNQGVINHIRSLVTRIPIATRSTVISTSIHSPYSGMTYQQLAEHIISLRTEHIQKLARPIVLKFYTHPRNFNIFNEPVDPIVHNLPHYFEIVKSPMDLGTIKCRLNASYYESLSDCFDDVRLVFNNAIVFNGSDSFVGKAAKDMLAEFEVDVAGLEDKNSKHSSKKCTHSCAHCSGAMCLLCGDKCLKLENTSFFCQGSCGQKIKKAGIYFVSKDALNVWCQKCHQSLPSVLGNYLDPDTKQPITLLKKDLLKRRHDEQTSEPWVECDRCGYWLHQICALYTDSSEHHEDYFSCPICILEGATSASSRGTHVIPVSESEIYRDMDSVTSHSDRDVSSVEISGISPFVQSIPFDDNGLAMLSARCLPTTRLSEFLEAMIRELLEAYGFEDAAQTLSIRVTSNIERTIDVNVPLQEYSRQLYGSELPADIPYRQKCIQLYQEIDGISVVLFSLYVHEFDENCPAPNTSTVYIAYLDSTDYFRPAQMRSFVYQEIVVGYLLWARARGFKNCHIWACPPQRGDNFIFWCHPSHQRTPSRDRLNAWYHSILTRAKRLGIHQGVSHLWNTFFAHLPCRNSETSTREVSKRSCSSLASLASVPRKYNKSNNGTRVGTNNEEVVVVEEFKSEAKVFPPIFEGDYWILEITRFYNNAIQRWKNSGQQSVAHAKTCRNILRTLMTSPLSIAFREPVDPVELNIPTYFEVVKQPMDLGSVRQRLEADGYKSVLDFAHDVRLTFRNAMVFNPSGHPIHQQADSLLKDFERRMSDVAGESRKLVYLTCLDSCSFSDDELLLRCKLAPMAQTLLQKSSSLKLETAVAGGADREESQQATTQQQPLTPGSRRSKRHRDASDADIVVKEERVGKAFFSEEKQRQTAQQSPTSVFEGRKEELFLCDNSFKLARSVSDDVGGYSRDSSAAAMDCDDTLQQRLSSRVSPPSPHLLGPRFQSEDSVQQSVADNAASTTADDVFPTINASALAALSATENMPSINVSSFTSDLSKSIQRLNDDLFVLRFAPEPLLSPDYDDDADEQQPQRLVPPGVGGKSKKVANLFVPRRCLSRLQNLPRDTSDPDVLMDNPLVDSRHTFLEMSQFRHMQFDTLRRAKHSSLTLVYHQLHRCDKRCGPVCSHCGDRIRNLRWHCEQCAGYEICQVCMLAKEDASIGAGGAGPAAAVANASDVVSKKHDSSSVLAVVVPDEDAAASSSKKLRKAAASLLAALPKRETRRRDSQLTQRREDDMFVYSSILSTHRQNQQQQQQQQSKATEAAPVAMSNARPSTRSSSSSSSSSTSSNAAQATSVSAPATTTTVPAVSPRTRERGGATSLSLSLSLSLASSGSSSDAAAAAAAAAEPLVQDFGVFPGHPHPLTPYRVTYQ